MRLQKGCLQGVAFKLAQCGWSGMEWEEARESWLEEVNSKLKLE